MWVRKWLKEHERFKIKVALYNDLPIEQKEEMEKERIAKRDKRLTKMEARYQKSNRKID